MDFICACQLGVLSHKSSVYPAEDNFGIRIIGLVVVGSIMDWFPRVCEEASDVDQFRRGVNFLKTTNKYNAIPLGLMKRCKLQKT